MYFLYIVFINNDYDNNKIIIRRTIYARLGTYSRLL